MQVITAQFITNTGFATWLIPLLKITSLFDDSVVDVIMEEVGNGNYKYEFNEYNDARVYFFNFDANDDSVVNRYQWTNNNEVKVLYSMSWGWSNVNIEEEDKKLAKKIAKEIKKDIFDYIDKKHQETLDAIASKDISSDVEIDYGIIDHSIEKNTLKIINKIQSIKIPKYDDTKVNNLIKKQIDISKDTSNTEKIIKNIDSIWTEIKEEIKQRTKWAIKEKDIKNIINEALSNDEDFKKLLLSQDEDFKLLSE